NFRSRSIGTDKIFSAARHCRPLFLFLRPERPPLSTTRLDVYRSVCAISYSAGQGILFGTCISSPFRGRRSLAGTKACPSELHLGPFDLGNGMGSHGREHSS